MHLTGTHTLNASVEQIWNMLMDAEVLARVTPGVSKLEQTDTDQCKAIAQVKMGPVSGSFEGELEVAEKSPPESFILKVKQNSRIGNVAADVKIHLKALDPNTTEMSFEGNAKLSGLLARTGQRVLSGVASTLSKQFFKSLEEEIDSTSPQS